MTRLTGPQLFLCYAFPCAEEKRDAQKITRGDFRALKLLIESGREPGISFLERCFPNATREMNQFWLGTYDACALWSPHLVGTFWHQHQGSGGDCAATKAMVYEVNGNAVSVMVDSKMFPAINLYGLDLQIGDMVYLHRRVVIEEAE